MYIILPIILLVIIFMSIRIVPQNHVAIIEQLGKYNRTVGAGINFVIPFIERSATQINLAIRNFPFQFEAVSQDKVNIHIKANLLYKVDQKSVYSYWYDLTDSRQTISSFVENYVRSFVATNNHEELLQKREEISGYLMEHLNERFLKWGIMLEGFQVTDIMFPTIISEAMSKVVASQRMREAAMNESEAQKVRVVKNAEAEKESRILMGEGVAGERQAIIDGLKKSIDDMKTIKDLNTHEVMNLIVLSQYFDTIRSVGSSQNAKVMFLNPAPQGANDIIQQLSSAIEVSNQEKGQAK